jgi:hypothetical protein
MGLRLVLKLPGLLAHLGRMAFGKVASPLLRSPIAALLALSLLLGGGSAHARRSGLAAAGCEGCHTGGKSPKVSITTEPAVFGPGETVIARVIIEAVNGGSGGLYFTADLGRFTAIAGEGVTVVSETELTHSAPKAASGGNVVFQVRWTAPAQPNAVYFEAWALSANGNGSANGDGEGYALSSVLFGCAGSSYYIDLDGDGFGDSMGTTLTKCAATAGFANRAGDCNDSNRDVYPGAVEQCNSRDDNCDGRVDEGLVTGTQNLYPDQDGDGYGVASASPLSVTGCAKMSGYAVLMGDCNDRSAAIHPGASDVCNLLDDNCDGRIDEQARPRCGKGWCERLSPSCDPAACVAGPPATEVCNGADDDCNGFVDDAPDVCPSGSVCRMGSCTPSDAAAGGGGRPTSGSSGGSRQETGGVTTNGGNLGSGGAPLTGGAVTDNPGGGGIAIMGGSGSNGSAANGANTAPSSGCAVRVIQKGERNAGLWLLCMTGFIACRLRRARAASRESCP